MSSERLIITCIPSLVSILLGREEEKGSPLTEQEVLNIRNQAVAVALPVEAAANVVKERGYRDIDPDHCWEEWQRYRLNLDMLVLPKA
ncbi:MAG TPA: hypothetical protein VG742_16595 [Dongiaceae bacterium]|nr:hypothetical protein [Dongiaceae bacterium]